jgi:hypothetical protein
MYADSSCYIQCKPRGLKRKYIHKICDTKCAFTISTSTKKALKNMKCSITHHIYDIYSINFIIHSLSNSMLFFNYKKYCFIFWINLF